MSPQQQKALADFYNFRKAETARVAGLETQAWVFEPKDGLRYGHKFWADVETGLIVKARVVDERNGVLEQFVVHRGFDRREDRARDGEADVAPGAARLEDPPIGAGRGGLAGIRLDRWPGFHRASRRSSTGSGALQGTRQVAHLVYSDGLVAVSVFVEPVARRRRIRRGFPRRTGSTSTVARWTRIW